MDNPVRKDIRLGNYDYSRNGAYFVTICTRNKQHYFWDYSKPVGGDAHIAPPINNDISDISTFIPYKLTDIGIVVQKYISNINGIMKYVIMPNHVHFIVKIDNEIVFSVIKRIVYILLTYRLNFFVNSIPNRIDNVILIIFSLSPR